MRFIKFTLCALALCFTVPAQSATLTGDVVKVDLNFSPTANRFATVGPGVDVTVQSAFHFDFDFGANNNEFLGFVTTFGGANSFGGLFGSAVVPQTIDLTDLNFSGGEILTGFQIDFSALSNTVATVVSGTALSISFIDGPFTGEGSGGTFLRGTFLTGPDTPVSAVPLPAAFPLFAGGLGLLGLLGWRRKRKVAPLTV